MDDLGAIALLLGVRDNDLQGLSTTDLAGIAVVQGDPTTQERHCLRSFSDLEPSGTATAAASCRAFILDRVTTALDFLDASGNPSADFRDALTVSLAVRGQVLANLPGFYVHMGQALHALQDSVSHSYRTSDAHAITAILNWLNVVEDDLDEATEGPEHNSSLDRCVGLDAFRQTRLQVAEDESAALLLAALGPGTRAARLAQVNTLLDSAFVLQPGCNAANNWCNAAERKYPAQFGGCAEPGGASLLCVLALLAFGFARRRRAASRSLLALLALLAASPVPARAEESQSDQALEERFADRPALGVAVELGGAIDHTAVDVGLGARLRLNPRWLLGLDVEWNPWLSLDGTHAQPGALNIYATGIPPLAALERAPRPADLGAPGRLDHPLPALRRAQMDHRFVYGRVAPGPGVGGLAHGLADRRSRRCLLPGAAAARRAVWLSAISLHRRAAVGRIGRSITSRSILQSRSTMESPPPRSPRRR